MNQPTKAHQILVVDDMINVRDLFRRWLVPEGYAVLDAADVARAWTLLKSHDVSLIVTDIGMPTLWGYDLRRRVRADADLSNTPFLLMNTLWCNTDRHPMPESPDPDWRIERLMTKPCNRDEFVMAVADLLSRD